MVLQILKFLTPVELQERVTALPDAARDYLSAESRYISLCANYMARQLALIIVATVAMAAIVFSMFNALLLCIFYLLSRSSYQFSPVSIVAIEAGIVLTLCLGTFFMFQSAMRRMKSTFDQFIRHWER